MTSKRNSKVVLNTESTDLNYGGWDVLVRCADDSWSCVAETKNPFLADKYEHVVETCRHVLLGNLK